MKTMELLSIVLAIGAAAGYLGGAILYLRNKETGALWCALVGEIFNAGMVLKNFWINGYAPFASMYQVLTVLALCFWPTYLLLRRKNAENRWLAPFFLIPAALPVVGTLFMDKALKWALVPALKSVFFVPHVFSYMLSYCLATVAVVLIVMEFTPMKRKHDLGGAALQIMRLSFPFMTVGLCLGALWADQVWGNFWQWDAKEVWSLITWLLYLAYFHSKRIKVVSITPRVMMILAYCSLIITFLCVNLLPSINQSFHIYT